MKTTLFSLIVLGALSLAAVADPIPSKYLTGPVSRDVAASLKRGQSENKPVWIVAWDEAFSHSPEGRNKQNAEYSLGNFYGGAETKKLLQENFIQVFASMKNPAIAAWLDAEDKTHEPVLLVITPDGNLFKRQHSSANAANGLGDVQKIIEQLKQKTADTK